MDRDTLKSLQAPLKQLYLANPEAAIAQLHATGILDFANLSCRVSIPAGDGSDMIAGLHPKAGGDGTMACSGDMLLLTERYCIVLQTLQHSVPVHAIRVM